MPVWGHRAATGGLDAASPTALDKAADSEAGQVSRSSLLVLATGDRSRWVAVVLRRGMRQRIPQAVHVAREIHRQRRETFHSYPQRALLAAVGSRQRCPQAGIVAGRTALTGRSPNQRNNAPTGQVDETRHMCSQRLLWRA
ncbi:hypothetical protein FRAHR75_560038 [Frankia sp. Hr75.2]|nr:hypothetical protein FRAHR75_560038 [Frankia sp. Hr75.2]